MRGKVITIRSDNQTFKAIADIGEGQPTPDIITFDGEFFVRNGPVYKKAVGEITLFHRVEGAVKRAGK